MGFKGDMDFSNQLNIMDLENLLNQGADDGLNLLKLPGAIEPDVFLNSLNDVPP